MVTQPLAAYWVEKCEVINWFSEVNEWNFLLPALLIHHHPHSNQEATIGQETLPTMVNPH
jgi:hypothetical protein